MTRAIVVFGLLLESGCASLGGAPALVDDGVASNAASLDDPELMKDVEALKNKRLGPEETAAGLCVQQYVRGRAAEVAVAAATDDFARRKAQSDMLGGYMTCAAQCELAAARTASPYAAIAAKYQPRCAAGSSASEESMGTEHLERLVATYREATQPLGLYFADKDAASALDYLREQGMNNADVERLAEEIEALRATNADAIEQGRAFFESPEAQANFQQRSANESEQEAIRAAIGRLEAELEEAKEAGLSQRAANLEIEIAAKAASLGARQAEHAELKSQYEAMAEQAGVFSR